ncbi:MULTISPECIES: hypothetical protein [Giesbergeria]|uniref:Uncharacterized protein n=1 Tax=Giesbergeria sinuosa TaxID=80883 RepID=A0ABV9QEE6_9BURK
MSERKTIESCLKSYDGYIDFWSDDAGDTEQLYKLRDHIHDRLGELNPTQQAELRKIDDKLLKLVNDNRDSQSWDAVMLRKTGVLVKDERY